MKNFMKSEEKMKNKKMKLGVLFSGGKDSCLALHIAKKQGHEICFLLSIIPENFDSFMFHKPYLELLKKQAEMLGVDLIVLKSKGIKEKELVDLKKLIEIVKDKIDGILVGGIASSYQGERVKKICSEYGLEFVAPLWNYKGDIWEELLKENFKVILTKIACEGISKEFLARIINKEVFEKIKKLSLKHKFRLDFEGGEAESAVLYMPEFKKEIGIKFKIKSDGKYRHWLEDVRVF